MTLTEDERKEANSIERDGNMFAESLPTVHGGSLGEDLHEAVVVGFRAGVKLAMEQKEKAE